MLYFFGRGGGGEGGKQSELHKTWTGFAGTLQKSEKEPATCSRLTICETVIPSSWIS